MCMALTVLDFWLCLPPAHTAQDCHPGRGDSTLFNPLQFSPISHHIRVPLLMSFRTVLTPLSATSVCLESNQKPQRQHPSSNPPLRWLTMPHSSKSVLSWGAVLTGPGGVGERGESGPRHQGEKRVGVGTRQCCLGVGGKRCVPSWILEQLLSTWQELGHGKRREGRCFKPTLWSKNPRHAVLYYPIFHRQYIPE